MSKFKVGDRVRRTEEFTGGCGLPSIPRGAIGTVIDDPCDRCPRVKFDGYPEIYSSDGFMELVAFSKADLKPGYVVEMRDGSKAIMCEYQPKGASKTEIVLVYEKGDHGWDRFGLVNDDLTWDGVVGSNHDITKVYGYSSYGDYANSANTEFRPLLWERKEAKKMTLKEICDALGYEVEIVKESDGK